MMPFHDRTVDRLDEIVQAAATLVTNADERAIYTALGDLANAGILDEPTMYFLGRTRAVTLALSMCLASVLDAHSEALVLGDRCCKECLTPAPCRTRRCLANAVHLYRLG